MEKVTYPEGHEVLRWKVGPSTFLAWPEAGARLMRWDVKLAKGRSRPVLYWPDVLAGDAEVARVRGGNPILFPFPARSFSRGVENRWRWAGEERPMPRHGFARGGVFELEEADKSGFSALLLPDEAAAEAYPFEYLFRVRYTFEELAVKVVLELENRQEEPIPWAPGHHFYFAVPWHEEARRGDYRIELPAKKAFYPTAEGGLAVADRPEGEIALDNPALLDRVHTHLTRREVRFGPKSGEEDVVVRVGEAPVPARDTAVVTWTENTESPFFCVEPWMGPPNSPEHGRGLQLVRGGETERFTVEVALA